MAVTHILKNGSVVSDLDGLIVPEQDAPTLYALTRQVNGGKHEKDQKHNFTYDHADRGSRSDHFGLLC